MIHRESDIQKSCFKWFKIQYREYDKLLFSIPNGAHVSDVQRRILMAEGMVSGVSDMMLLLPRHGYHGLMIEFKTDKGRQSENQKAFQEAVERQGYLYCIVRSCTQFIDVINAYITKQ